MKKILPEIAPLVLMVLGTLAITFSTNFIDQSQGLIKVLGEPLKTAEQNATLLYLGLFLFIIGAILEIVRICKAIKGKN